MISSRHHNAGKSHSMKIKNVEKFKYLGPVTYQYNILE